MVGATRYNIHATVGSITIPGNLELTPSMGRIPKLVPSSIDNRWRVQTPSNMPIKISQRALPTPPLSLRVPLLPFFSDKSVSEPCLIIKERLCTGMRDLHTSSRKHRLSVQAQYLLWAFVNCVSNFGVVFFARRPKIEPSSALLFLVFGCFVKTCNVGETTESTSHRY